MPYPILPANYDDIDGVLWGWRWDANLSNGHTQLTYAFPTSTTGYAYAIGGFQAFNAAQVAAAERALALYDSVSNLDFVKVTDPAAGNIRFCEADWVNVGTGNISIGTALGAAPDPNFAPLFAQGDTWFNHTSYNNPTLGSFAFASGILHEVGHALGLKHGHLPQEVKDAAGNVLYSNPALPANHDSLEYSIMTYRSRPGGNAATVDAVEFPSTLMQDDIFAIQYLYGANYEFRAGDTTYTFSPKTGAMYVNGVSQGATFHHKIFLTIWDGGGRDTYDFSNYRTNAVIDLEQGAWSTPSQAQRADLDYLHPGKYLARGSIANALLFRGDTRGYIENGIGGIGNDRISGNEMANMLAGGKGKDVLAGDFGIDRLVGGPGADRFDFNSIWDSAAGRRDTIADFSRGGGDRIDLSSIDADQRSGAGGNQAFVFIGADSFAHYNATHGGTFGMVRFSGGVLQANVDGLLGADFEVRVAGVGALGAGDLVL